MLDLDRSMFESSLCYRLVRSLIHDCVFCLWRFHNPAKEPALNYDVVLPVDDDVQLSVVQYRNKLYEVLNLCSEGSIEFVFMTLDHIK